MSYDLYIDSNILVYYIKDILPEALNEDLEIVINICKKKIREYEETEIISKLYKVYETEYSISKINQAIYLLLNIFKNNYPEYKENINRLLKLMKIRIYEEKKESLKK